MHTGTVPRACPNGEQPVPGDEGTIAADSLAANAVYRRKKIGYEILKAIRQLETTNNGNSSSPLSPEGTQQTASDIWDHLLDLVFGEHATDGDFEDRADSLVDELRLLGFEYGEGKDKEVGDRLKTYAERRPIWDAIREKLCRTERSVTTYIEKLESCLKRSVDNGKLHAQLKQVIGNLAEAASHGDKLPNSTQTVKQCATDLIQSYIEKAEKNEKESRTDESDTSNSKKKKGKRSLASSLKTCLEEVLGGGARERQRRLKHMHSYFLHMSLERGLEEPGEDDQDDRERTARKQLQKTPIKALVKDWHLACMLGALVCDAGLNRVAREIDDKAEWDKCCHIRFVHLIRNPQGNDRSSPETWFNHVVRLVEKESSYIPDQSHIDGVLSILNLCRDRIQKQVTSVVGIAKELLDARLILNRPWPCVDGVVRKATHVWISGYKNFPSLVHWREAAGGKWRYDPFREFSLKVPANVALRSQETSRNRMTPFLEYMDHEMSLDRNGVDIGIALEEMSETCSRVSVSVALWQCKFRSNPNYVFKAESGNALESYTMKLENDMTERCSPEQFNLDQSQISVESYWSTTSVTGPPPFDRSIRNPHSAVDRKAQASSQFQSLAQGAYGENFGRGQDFLVAHDYSIFCIDSSTDHQSRIGVMSFQPRGLQGEAIEKGTQGLRNAPHTGQIIVPCAFGKTFVAFWIARNLWLDNSIQVVVFVCPLQRLCAQSFRGWYKYAEMDENLRHQVDMVVCMSDGSTPGVLHCPPGKDIASWAKYRLESERKCAIFITYDSLQVLKDVCAAQDVREKMLVIGDEAHWSSGRRDKFGYIHQFHGKYRLFLTATPGIHPKSALQLPEEDTNGFEAVEAGIDEDISQESSGPSRQRRADPERYDRETFACQNDIKGPFGKCLYKASWKDCIEQGMLVGTSVHPLAARGLDLSEEENKILCELQVSISPEVAQALLGLDDHTNRVDDPGMGEQVPVSLAQGPRERQEREEGQVIVENLRAELEQLQRQQVEMEAKRKCIEDDIRTQRHPQKIIKTVSKKGLKRKSNGSTVQETLVDDHEAGPSAGGCHGAEEDLDTLKELVATLQKNKKEVQKELNKMQSTISKTKKQLKMQRSLLSKQLAKPNSLRLFDMLSNLVHQIVTSPETGKDCVSHVVSYHNTVPRAMHAMALCHFIIAAQIEESQTNGKDEEVMRLLDLQLGCLSSYQPGHQQEREIQRFAGSRCGIIFNVRLMSIGQDVPQINGIAFVDIVHDPPRIVQSIGRAMRLFGIFGSSKLAHVFFPVLGPACLENAREGNDVACTEGGSLNEDNVNEDDEDDMDEDEELHLKRPQDLAQQMVKEYIQTLPEDVKETMCDDSDEYQKCHALAISMAQELSGYGPQDLQVLGYMFRADAAAAVGKRDQVGVLLGRLFKVKSSRRRLDCPDATAPDNNVGDDTDSHVLYDTREDPELQFGGSLLQLSLMRCALRIYGSSSVQPWMLSYLDVERYLRDNNNEYPTKETNTVLYYWIQRQRKIYNGTAPGCRPLTHDQIQKLKDLPGWMWNNDEPTDENKIEALELFLKKYQKEPQRGDQGTSISCKLKSGKTLQINVANYYIGLCSQLKGYKGKKEAKSKARKIIDEKIQPLMSKYKVKPHNPEGYLWQTIKFIITPEILYAAVRAWRDVESEMALEEQRPKRLIPPKDATAQVDACSNPINIDRHIKNIALVARGLGRKKTKSSKEENMKKLEELSKILGIPHEPQTKRDWAWWEPVKTATDAKIGHLEWLTVLQIWKNAEDKSLGKRFPISSEVIRIWEDDVKGKAGRVEIGRWFFDDFLPSLTDSKCSNFVQKVSVILQHDFSKGCKFGKDKIKVDLDSCMLSNWRIWNEFVSQRKGQNVVHFPAPQDKYFQPGESGGVVIHIGSKFQEFKRKCIKDPAGTASKLDEFSAALGAKIMLDKQERSNWTDEQYINALREWKLLNQSLDRKKQKSTPPTRLKFIDSEGNGFWLGNWIRRVKNRNDKRVLEEITKILQD